MNFFSETHDDGYGIRHVLFGIFGLMNYVIPYFMWSSIVDDFLTPVLIMRMFAGIVCCMLLIRDFWFTKYKALLSTYWFFALLYGLPFITTYMFLCNHGSAWWLINCILGMFLLSMLTHWLAFFTLASLGILFSTVIYRLTSGPIYIEGMPQDINLWSTYIFTGTAIIVSIIIQNQKKQKNPKIESMNALGGAIAHEMRTPLITLNMFADGVIKNLPALMNNYYHMQTLGIAKERIAPSQIVALKEAADGIKLTTRNAFGIIDMILVKIKTMTSSNTDPAVCSITQCILDSFDKHPLTQEEISLIDLSGLEDFQFIGNPLLMEHVLLNMIKNSLYYVKKAAKGSVTLHSERTDTSNILYIQDSGLGIVENYMPFIFDRFYTKTPNGTGIGLFFCKHVIESFGGEVSCSSTLNQYTQFRIVFPLLKNKPIET